MAFRQPKKTLFLRENSSKMRRHLYQLIGIAAFLVIIGGTAAAQTHTLDFDDQNEAAYPWFNIRIVADSNAASGNFVCLCDSLQEYGMGFGINAAKDFPNQNINCKFNFLFKADTNTQADIVVSIDDTIRNRYWTAYPLVNYINDTAEWSQVQLDLYFPASYTQGSEIKVYIWNKGKEFMKFDDAQLEIKADAFPSYQPVIGFDADSLINLDYYPQVSDFIPIVEYINADGDTLTNPSVIETQFSASLFFLNPNEWENFESGKKLQIMAETRFKEDMKLLRLAYALPLPEGKITVYRRNQHIDSTNLQSAYYLDREGFSIKSDTFSLYTYHNTNISSLQLDVENRIACFNIDYWRDHPLIHYPLMSDTSDVFEDISYREIHKGETISSEITLYYNIAMDDLPRLMPVWDGYQSAFIFTEHADWTDIRTHRAVLFGSEKITKARDATGGFVYYGIPVTKSVFYNNPDGITNSQASHGTFTGLQTTIKTSREFERLLQQLHKLGFDLCLHTPEQYTTTPDNLKEALDYMRRHFKSTAWIDHGYNNGPKKNREDLVCDGLDRGSIYYAAELWQRHGIRYLWNAYYEENRMEAWHFDNNLTQPYPGFGDALPNRQVGTIAGYDYEHTPIGEEPMLHPDFLTWSTPSTLEATKDADWDFFFSKERLQKLIDQHSVFITHIYPAWVVPGRTFWTYDADSTIVAPAGMNRAFERIATLRDEHLLLPMTVKTYLNHYESLLQVHYEIIDAEHIRLHNNGKAVKGFTLCCQTPIRFDDNRFYEYRKSDGQYYIWFDLKANDSVTISIK